MAKELIYLISITTLKEEYGFDDNIEDRYILPNIQKCQNLIIRPLLGEDKWKEIIKQINEDTVSELNDELIKEYISPIIAYYVMSESIYNTAYKLKNTGLEDSDNSNRFNELVRLSKKYLIDSDAFQSRLKQWMCLYTPLTVDPLYRYKCPIYLGNDNGIDYNNLPDKPKI